MTSNNVCRFFLTPSGCRYGTSCRFSHERIQPNRYVYNVKNTGNSDGTSIMRRGHQSFHQEEPVAHSGSTALRELVDSMAAEAEFVEQCKIWPLTVVSVTKQGNIPGWHDVSQEEVRDGYYTARANGTLELHLREVAAMIQKASLVHDMYKKRGRDAEQVLRDHLSRISHQGPHSTDVASVPGTGPIVSFSGFAPSNMSSVSFAKPFTAPTPNTNFMRPTHSSTPAGNVFFGAQPQQPELHDAEMFTADVSSFVSSTPINFGTVPSPPVGAFSSPSFFGASPAPPRMISSVSADDVNYSKREELTPEDLEQFKSTTFTYGKIPFKPPPKDMCF